MSQLKRGLRPWLGNGDAVGTGHTGGDEPGPQRDGRSASLLQESPAAPHALLVDGLKVGVVALGGQGGGRVTNHSGTRLQGACLWPPTAGTQAGSLYIALVCEHQDGSETTLT